MSLSSIEAREARILGVRLGYGFCGLDDVEQWATRLIERMDDPPYALLQLGLARVNGADVCFEAFGSLGVGKLSPAEFLFAMSVAEPEVMSPQRKYDLLGSIWSQGLEFIQQDPDSSEPALTMLMDALNAQDVIGEYTVGGVSANAAQLAASEYFRRLRKAAADLAVTS